jgi:hypothetical protein
MWPDHPDRPGEAPTRQFPRFSRFPAVRPGPAGEGGFGIGDGLWAVIASALCGNVVFWRALGWNNEMSSGSYISIHDKHQLDDYFNSHVKPSKVRWLIPRSPSAIEISGGDSWLGKVTRAVLSPVVKHAFTSSGFYHAAWEWLQPKDPVLAEDELAALQKRCGLSTYTSHEFLGRLREECIAIVKKNPGLFRWGQKRISILEFEISESVRTNLWLSDFREELHDRIVEAASLINGLPEEADQQLSEISKLALLGVSQTAQHHLGKPNSKCRVSANLMVRVENPLQLLVSTHARFQLAKRNSKLASDLWRDLDVRSGHLMIIDETEGSNHIGFWVPLTSGQNGEAIPGAPLDGFSRAVSERWQTYIRDNLNAQMFVSLPIFSRADKGVIGGSSTNAVININADPNDDGWMRAHHSRCLQHILESIAPFAEIAWRALVLRCRIGQGGMAKIDFSGKNVKNPPPRLMSPPPDGM